MHVNATTPYRCSVISTEIVYITTYVRLVQSLHRRQENFDTRGAKRPHDGVRTEYIGSPSPNTPVGTGILSLPASSAPVGGRTQAALYGTDPADVLRWVREFHPRRVISSYTAPA